MDGELKMKPMNPLNLNCELHKGSDNIFFCKNLSCKNFIFSYFPVYQRFSSQFYEFLININQYFPCIVSYLFEVG